MSPSSGKKYFMKKLKVGWQTEARTLLRRNWGYAGKG
jgi:hypothetical protein